MITYTKKDGEEGVIIKVGHSVEFNIGDVRPHIEKMEKLKKELTAQVELEKAKQANIEAHHEVVKTLEGEQKAAIAIHYTSDSIIAQAESKLKEIEALLAEYAKELKEIEEQTGITV